MKTMRSITMLLVLGALCAADGCVHHDPLYGVETPTFLPGAKRRVWAVAPALNLSGERVDPLLQADIVYGQLQQVQGLTVIPVNRVVEVYAALHLEKVQSPEQAAVVCDKLGCDGLIVPTVTAFDPFNPPKLGASLQLFQAGRQAPEGPLVDPRELARQATPGETESLPAPSHGAFIQVVGVYDAANGSVHSALLRYAQGRNDPMGPYGAKEYLVSMDRYCEFVYHVLIVDLLNSPKLAQAPRG